MSDVRIRSTIRNRRQITLPHSVCKELGIEVGDSVEMRVKSGALVITPSRQRALDALDALQRAFAESGVTLEEILEEGKRQRKKLVRELYGQRPAAKRLRR